MRLVQTSAEGVVTKGFEQQVCLIAEECGGCGLINLPYKQQLQVKQNRLKELLEGNADALFQLKDIEASQNSLSYQSFAHLEISDYLAKGKRLIDIGYHHPILKRVVDIKNCPVLLSSINHLVRSLRMLINDFKIPTKKSRKDEPKLLKATIKWFPSGGFLILHVTTAQKGMFRELVSKLLERHKLIGVILSDEKQDVLMTGDDKIEETILQKKFWLHYLSVKSTNPVQEERLIQYIESMIRKKNPKSIYDYSEILTLRQKFFTQSFPNYKTLLSKRPEEDLIALDVLEGSTLKTLPCSDVFLFERPRTFPSNVWNWLSTEKPQTLIFMTSFLQHLKNDLLLLSKCYKIQEIKPFDLKPGTEHIQLIVTLQKK